MTADIVNLRRARKERTRTERQAKAAENRRVFGRTKAEKDKAAAEREQADRLIEAHRRDRPKD